MKCELIQLFESVLSASKLLRFIIIIVIIIVIIIIIIIIIIAKVIMESRKEMVLI